MEILKKELPLDFEAALDHVQNAVSDEFSVLMTKSISDAIISGLGLDDYPLRATVIMACAPSLAKKALEVSTDTINLMPCSFVVYEEQGKVMVSHLSIMKSAVELGLADMDSMKPVISETGEKVKRVWAKL